MEQTDVVIMNDELMPMEPWGYTVAAIVLFFIGVFGFGLNIFVIILMCRDLQLWTPMNIILFNLVCSDFSVSVIGNPFTLISAIAHHWIFGRNVCIAYGFFMSLLGITSITTLTVLSYERFCLVSCPFSTKQLSNRGAALSIIFIWGYSFTLTSPPLFGWGAYVKEAANISCSVNWESQTLNATSYIVFLFVFGFFIPVIIILYSYIKIILTMRATSLRLGRVNRAEGRVTWMVGIMVIAFMVAWTPYAIFALFKQFGPRHLIGPGMAVLPALIAKSSICYNPLIYVGMNTQFRAAWNRFRGKDTIATETTVNQITQTSSKLSIDCSFGRVKRKYKFNIYRQANLENARLDVKNRLQMQNIMVNGGGVGDGDDNTVTELNNSIANNSNNNIDDTNRNNQLKLQNNKTDYELSVISSGQTILIKTNSYKSNIC